MLPRAHLAGEEACMVLQASSLSGRIYSKEMMLAISEERCCVVSVVEKKKRPFFETIRNQKAREWSTTRKRPLKITPPTGNFYRISSLLSAASTRLSSYLFGGPESEHILKERKVATRRRCHKAQDLGSQGRGFMDVFSFNSVPKSLSLSPRGKGRDKIRKSVHRCLIGA